MVEDQFLDRKDIGLLHKALARRYQQKLVKHKRNLENRMNRRQQIIKGKGLPLDVTPDDELSDGGYSSIEEFKDKETLPHRYRIKRSRFRENYPSLFDYPNEIPKHHTVDRLCFVTVVGSFQLKMLSVRQGTQHFTDESKASRK